MRWKMLSAIVFVTVLTSCLAPSQKSARKEAPPKYDLSSEAKSKGVVSEVYGFSFAKDDQIEIVGSKMTMGERRASWRARSSAGLTLLLFATQAVNRCGNCQVDHLILPPTCCGDLECQLLQCHFDLRGAPRSS